MRSRAWLRGGGKGHPYIAARLVNAPVWTFWRDWSSVICGGCVDYETRTYCLAFAGQAVSGWKVHPGEVASRSLEVLLCPEQRRDESGYQDEQDYRTPDGEQEDQKAGMVYEKSPNRRLTACFLRRRKFMPVDIGEEAYARPDSFGLCS